MKNMDNGKLINTKNRLRNRIRTNSKNTPCSICKYIKNKCTSQPIMKATQKRVFQSKMIINTPQSLTLNAKNTIDIS